MWLLLIAFAQAHVPHDTALSLVVPPDGNSAEPWFLLLNPQGIYLWLRSDDAGRTWNMIGGEPLEEDPLGAARTDAGEIEIVNGEHIWSTTDAGATWTQSDVPGSISMVRSGPTITLAGDGGLWQGSVGGGWTQEIATPITAIGLDSALAVNGHVWVNRGGWTDVGAGVSQIASLAADSTNLYVGTRDGTVLKNNGVGWDACGQLPTEDVEHNDVVQMTLTGDTLIVATGILAPYVSTDGCHTWNAPGSGVSIDYGTGGAEQDNKAFTYVMTFGDLWALGGWAGAQFSTDHGTTWANPPLVPADYTRGLAFAQKFPTEPQLYVGAYAAGVQISSDGGQTWIAPNHGLTNQNVQQVKADPTSDGTVYSVVNHYPYVSYDEGEHWASFLPDDGSTAEYMYPFGTPGRVWIVGEVIWETKDDGVSFTDRTDLDETLGASHLAGLLTRDGHTCVTLGDPTGFACSDDDTVTWTIETTETEGRATEMAPYPPANPDFIFWGDADGIHREPADGVGGELYATAPIIGMASGTDAVFAVTRGGQLLRSDDGGETWVEKGDRLPAHVHRLAVRPDWDDHPELVAATHDGVYIGTAEGVWHRLDHQVLDNSSTYFDCQDCPAATSDGTGNFDTYQLLSEFAVDTAWVRGSHILIEGRSSGGGAGVRLTIDGVDEGGFGANEQVGHLAQIDGLENTWHEVVMSGQADSTVELDTLEAYGDFAGLAMGTDTGGTETGGPDTDTAGDSSDDSGVRPHHDSTPTARHCGCASGDTDSSAALGLLALGVLAVRRTR